MALTKANTGLYTKTADKENVAWVSLSKAELKAVIASLLIENELEEVFVSNESIEDAPGLEISDDFERDGKRIRVRKDVM